MARPSDWSALGYSSDPTPGNPGRVEEITESQNDLVTLAETIDSGLDSVLETTDGSFVGETADALRDLIDNRLRDYVSSFRQAHQDVQSALTDYAEVLRTQQRRADQALETAMSLPEDDESGRDAERSTVEDAKSKIQDAAESAAATLRRAGGDIASPIDPCEEFWKMFQIFAIILAVLAIPFGGPVALAAIAFNVTLLIKTAIDFSNGKGDVTGLVLAILGVLVPTTKAVNVVQLAKAGWAFLSGGKFAHRFSLGLIFGLDDLARLSTLWTRGGNGLFTRGSIMNNLHHLGKLSVLNNFGARGFLGINALASIIRPVAHAGGIGKFLVAGVSGWKSLRFVLPVAADEMGRGIGLALRIGFIDRGVFGLYRYGAFVNGQFLGAGSKLSGAAGAAMDLVRGGQFNGFGSMPPFGSHGSPGGFSNVFTPGNGQMTVPPLRTGLDGNSFQLVRIPPMGGLSNGISGGIVATPPNMGQISGVMPSGGLTVPPTMGSFGVNMAPTGGLNFSAPSFSIGTPSFSNLPRVEMALTDSLVSDIPRLHLPGNPGAVASVGNVSAPAPSQVSLAPPGQVNLAGVSQLNISAPAVSHTATGALGQVGLPSTGQIGGALGQVSLPGTGQLGQLNLGGVSQTGLPATGQIGQLNLGSVGQVGLPSTGQIGQLNLGSVNQVGLPATGQLGTGTLGQVNTAALGTFGQLTPPAMGQLGQPGAGQFALSPVEQTSIGAITAASGLGINGGVPSTNLAVAPGLGLSSSPAGAPGLNGGAVSGGQSTGGFQLTQGFNLPGITSPTLQQLTPPPMHAQIFDMAGAAGRASDIQAASVVGLNGGAVAPNGAVVDVPQLPVAGASVSQIPLPGQAVAGAAVAAAVTQPAALTPVPGLIGPPAPAAANGGAVAAPAGSQLTPPPASGNPALSAGSEVATPARLSDLPATVTRNLPPPGQSQTAVPPAAQIDLGALAPPPPKNTVRPVRGEETGAVVPVPAALKPSPFASMPDKLAASLGISELSRTLMRLGITPPELSHLTNPNILRGSTDPGTRLNHTFRIEGEDGVPGVEFRTSPGSQPGRPLDVELRYDGAPVPGINWHYQPDHRMLRITYQPAGSESMSAWGVVMDSHHVVSPISPASALQYVTPGSTVTGGPVTGVAPTGQPAPPVPTPAAAVPQPAPPAPQTVRLGGQELTLTPVPGASGAPTTFTTTVGGRTGGGFDARLLDDGITLRVTQTLDAGHIRNWDVDTSAGYRFTGGAEELRLTGPGNVPHAIARTGIGEDGAPVGQWQLTEVGDGFGGAARMLPDGRGFQVQTDLGVRLYGPGTGALTHDGVRISGGDLAGNFAVTRLGDSQRLLIDADGNLVNGSWVTRDGTVQIQLPGQSQWHIHTPGGRHLQTALRIDDGVLPGGHLRLPEPNATTGPFTTHQLTDIRGEITPGRTTITPQTDGGFRVHHTPTAGDNSPHVLINANGNHTHDVTAFTDYTRAPIGQFALSPPGRPEALQPHPVNGLGDVQAATSLVRRDGTVQIQLPGQSQWHIHTPGGRHLQTALRIDDGVLPGGHLRLPEPNATTGPFTTHQLTDIRGDIIPGRTTITPQADGGFRVHHTPTAGGHSPHVVINSTGNHTHDVTAFTDYTRAPIGQFALSPPGARNTFLPHAFGETGPLATHNLQRVDNLLRVHDGRDFQAFRMTGALDHRGLGLVGGPLNGGYIRTAPGSTSTVLGADFSRIQTTLDSLPDLNGGSFRVAHGGRDVVYGRTGDLTHDALHLTPGPTNLPPLLQLTPTGPNPVATLHTFTGHQVNGSVTALPDSGGLKVVTDVLRVHRADGTLRFTALPFNPPGADVSRFIRNYGSDFAELLDANLVRVPNARVTPIPDPAQIDRPSGYRVLSPDGTLSFTGRDGRVLHIATPETPGTQSPLRVTNPGGNGQPFTVVRLADGIETRFVRTGPDPQLLDGSLTRVDNVTITVQGGNYRITPNVGTHTARHGEFQVYTPAGRLVDQRINVLHNGTAKPDTFYLISYRGNEATWVRYVPGPAGVQGTVSAPGTGWFDSGTAGLDGIGHGQVRLLTHSGEEVFQRRPLPDGSLLDAGRPVGGDFGVFGQRPQWHQVSATGLVSDHGVRQFGRSGDSWYDVRGDLSGTRVRHFQKLEGGGHVLAKLDNATLTQPFRGPSTWTRFGDDLRPLAGGVREWGLGYGWKDTMRRPGGNLGDASMTVHERYGRVTLRPHDNRRLFAVEFDASGFPTPSWKSLRVGAGENGSGTVLPTGNGGQPGSGSFLDVVRLAEQRPPVFVRNLAMWRNDVSGDAFSNTRYLRGDSAHQVHLWSLSPTPGADTTLSGVRLVGNNSFTTDLSSAGHVLRTSRPLPNDLTLTTGDQVALPPGALRVDGRVAWTEGTGGLSGVRVTGVGNVVTRVGGVRTGEGVTLVWQDRFNPGLQNGNWYSRADDGWHLARSGLSDGSVVDYRPIPRTGADDAPAGLTRTDIDGLGASDWTRLNHHGLVIGRQDTWPGAGAGNGAVTVTSHGGPGGKDLKWTDSLGGGGQRVTAFDGRMGQAWNLESYRDFQGNQLVREFQLLGDGTSLRAWRTPTLGANGKHVWHWDKVDSLGNIMRFDARGATLVREWFGPPTGGMPGTTWQDIMVRPDHSRVKIQELPSSTYSGPRHPGGGGNGLGRVREFIDTPAALPAPGQPQNLHVWKEFDHGKEFRSVKELPDGRLLEQEKWQDQWRLYQLNEDGSRYSLVAQRTISGFVYETDFTGRLTMTGREFPAVGLANDFRGHIRQFGDVNRFQFGRAGSGESEFLSFGGKAGLSLTQEFVMEWTLEFLTTMAVFAIGAGEDFSGTDVLKALFIATVGASVGTTFSAAHLAANRGGGWKAGLGEVDGGGPFTRQGSGDNWRNKYGGIEPVLGWRSGSYDFGKGIAVGVIASFINGAALSAIFGEMNEHGEIVKLTGTDALLQGVTVAAAGLTAGVSAGAARFMMHQSFGGRGIHQKGPLDALLIPTMTKIGEKYLVIHQLIPTFVIDTAPDWYTTPLDPEGDNDAD